MRPVLAIIYVVLGLLLSACVSLSAGIGAAYVSIETMAETIQLECGNAEPGGDCVSTSLLERADVDRMKTELQRAKDAVDDANRIFNAGNPGEAVDHLDTARTVLAGVRTVLESRGVQ